LAVPRGTKPAKRRETQDKTREKQETIGTMDPETDKLVLQEPKSAPRIQKLAAEEHEEAAAGIRKAIENVSGAVLFADRAEKDQERVAEKVEDGRSPRTIRDYSGFRIAVDSPQAWKQSAAALRKAFEVPEEQDEFEKGSELNFHGHTLQVRLPGSSVTHEVQILPFEVADAADDDHALYEKQREGDKDAERQLKDKNRKNWIEFLDRNDQAKYKFGSTQADIDPDSEAGKALEAARAKIADEDLAGDGKDIGGNHVTVRYGIHGSSDPEALRGFLRKQAPFEVTLGPTEAFPVSAHSEGAAPIFAPVESPELRRIHGEIEKHGDFEAPSFAEYRPHATVAYVKPSVARKYTGLRETAGKRFRVDAISLSHRDGTEDRIQLAGDSASSAPRSAQKPGDSATAENWERKGGRGESPEPLSGAVKAAPDSEEPRTVIGEKLRAALAGKRGSVAAKPTPADQWKKGDRFVAPDGDGGLESGIVRYWNPGYNGKESPVGEVRIGGTRKADHLPAGALRVRVTPEMLQPVVGTPEEAEEMARAAPDLASWVSDYLVRNTREGVTTIATDAAKKLQPAFEVDPIRNDRTVVAVAAAIRDGALNTMLGAPPPPGREDALIVVASPGSGKTTRIALGGPQPGIGLMLEVIPDDPQKFTELLRQILDSGRRPIVEWVWAGKPETTARRNAERALGRGVRPGIGRTVATSYMARSWAGLPASLAEVRKAMGDRVIWLVADNSGAPGKATVSGNVGPALERAQDQTIPETETRMNAELDRMDAVGRFAGERGQAVLAAARKQEAGLPRKEEISAPQGLREKLRQMADRKAPAARPDLQAIVEREQAAWDRAGKKLRDDPRAQVPF
jgi:2'-5' RNA ligase